MILWVNDKSDVLKLNILTWLLFFDYFQIKSSYESYTSSFTTSSGYVIHFFAVGGQFVQQYLVCIGTKISLRDGHYIYIIFDDEVWNWDGFISHRSAIYGK